MTPRRRRPSPAARSHKWPLGAFAQLLDAAQSSNGVWIDVHRSARGEPFFVLRDRGQGLSDAQLQARTAVHTPVRQWLKGDAYACPWQAAAFRLGADVTILSKTPDACYVALLSRERVADLRDPESCPPNIVMRWHNSVNDRDRLVAAVCTYSPWQTVSHISHVFDSISPTGTLVAISSLKRDLQQAELELDFSTDRYDIRLSALAHKEHNHFISSIRLSHSLRSYLEMLYLNPTFRIYLRDRIVRERRLSASMFGRQDFVYNYTPTAASHSCSSHASKNLEFRLGFDHCAHENEYGMLLYYKQRLVKPYLKLGFQIQPRNQIRVVAIVEADHLTPTSNMQSFEEDDAYQDLIFALGQSLKLFWTQYGSMVNAYRSHCKDPMLKWVRCDVCAHWRQLGPNVPHPSDTSSAQWTCAMNAGGTSTCNQSDDVCRQKVPVRVLEKRPISPISPPKECRKRSRSSTSTLGNAMKRPRNSVAFDASLVNVGPSHDNGVLDTTSPIPNLQSPIGFDSCTPEIVASDGAELRTDPFSLDESDSPRSRSTSSPGNMLEKAAKAKPLPSTVRHTDSELRGLEAAVFPSDNTEHPVVNHARWGYKENAPKACVVGKGTSAADVRLPDPLMSSQPPASSRGGDQGDSGNTERPNVYNEGQNPTNDKEQAISGDERFNNAVVSESRPGRRNTAITCPTRSEVTRKGKPVSVPLVREVVVHSSAQVVDINNRNSTVKVYPETRQHIPHELLLASADGPVPVVSGHPQPYDTEPGTNASNAQRICERPCTVTAPKDTEPNPQTLANTRFEGDTPETRNRRNNEEEAIKLLLNLRSREYDGQSGVGKTSADVDPERDYETKVVAELNGVSRLQNGIGAHTEDCRQASHDIPDPFGDKSKPVTPALALLQTPMRTVQDIPQRGVPTQFGSMPGMPSPNTANPFLDVTAEDVLEANPLNGIDISKDFLDLSDIDAGLKTPSQLKSVPKRDTPQYLRSNMREGHPRIPAQPSPEAVPHGAATKLNPPNTQPIQSAPANRVMADEGNSQEQRQQHCGTGEEVNDPNTVPQMGEHVCLDDGMGAKQSSRGSLVRHCGRGVEGGSDAANGSSRERPTPGTLRVSDISSMIPWSQIAATAAAAGAVAAAAAARDAGVSSQPRAKEPHPTEEGYKLKESQEEVAKLKKELQDQKHLTDTYKEKFQELICALAPAIGGRVTKLIRNPNEIDVLELSSKVLKSVTENAKEEANIEQLQAIESCKASEQIACSSLEKLRGLVRTFLEEAVGLTTQNEQDKPVDRHFEEYLNALDVFPP